MMLMNRLLLHNVCNVTQDDTCTTCKSSRRFSRHKMCSNEMANQFKCHVKFLQTFLDAFATRRFYISVNINNQESIKNQ